MPTKHGRKFLGYQSYTSGKGCDYFHDLIQLLMNKIILLLWNFLRRLMVVIVGGGVGMLKFRVAAIFVVVIVMLTLIFCLGLVGYVFWVCILYV